MATVILSERARKDGKSYVVYYDDPFTGRRKYHKTFRRKTDAVEEAHRLRLLIDTGKVRQVEQIQKRHRPMTFSEIADLCRTMWEEKLLLKQIRPKTIKGYNDQLAVVERTFGKRLAFEITRKDIKEYRLQSVKNYSAVTANRRLFVLKQVFGLAVQEGAVREDPTVGVTYLSEDEHMRKRFLLPADIDELLAACEKTKAFYLKPIFLLSVEHAAAKQEILDLEWKHIDFEQNIVRFYRTKNGMERIQKLMPRTREALLAWRNHLNDARKRKCIREPKTELVFSHLDGSPRKGFKSAWKRVLQLAGIKDYHFHDNRHTFCTNIQLNGGTPRDIMDMVGHRDPEMMYRYTQVASVRQEALQRQLAEHYTLSEKTRDEVASKPRHSRRACG